MPYTPKPHADVKSEKMLHKQFLLHELTNETERCLIGAILIMASDGDTTAINEVKRMIAIEDFYYPLHKRIYAAMLSAEDCNQVTTAWEMYAQGTYQANDAAEMSDLIARCPCPLDYLHYAKAVKNYSLLRSGKPPIPKIKGGSYAG